MTTLTNPTDDELNEAFALHVCKWTLLTVDDMSGERVYQKPSGTHVVVDHHGFIGSMDAVLPWLEKHRELDFKIALYQYDGWHWNVDGGENCHADSWTLPRACVLALLKAHGVEVVYDSTVANH